MKPDISCTLAWRLVFGVGVDFSMLAYNLKDKLKIITLWIGPLCVCIIFDPTKKDLLGAKFLGPEASNDCGQRRISYPPSASGDWDKKPKANH